MKISLPDQQGRLVDYSLKGTPLHATCPSHGFNRSVFSAAHVVADPFTSRDPGGPPAVDWKATMAFRHHLADLGLGIAEAMDTAQRGMGLDWAGALELIRRTREELPDALVFSGAGTDHLDLHEVRSLDDVRRAYCDQIAAIQALGGRIILMASRALVRVASGPDDYIAIYRAALSACDRPVILHWLGDMFDQALSGYWGSDVFESAMRTCLDIIEENKDKIEGIKISLLDKEKEIRMRRRLPLGVKMYTGDDFNYPELIDGDEAGFSHALLGIFDPLAPAAAAALTCLAEGDRRGFHDILDPTVPLARAIFRAPTQYYKTGVVFMSWLNGFQDHFIMLNGHQAMRPLPYFCDVFRLADGCGLLCDGDLAVARMKSLLRLYGV
ncbi:dihydrodipicolinate synthase family protein [Gluconacetobacter tumulisoli]|uniref:Dihydrodipicolinate synthase family protein n=1 Tax=Gluconacetobacter tumulisoli TaxID=1286189 RepID=A0A7W4K5R7_9PROT|nr:dihydrodipicolinate synthase family protein [Gluconacetobacter tumulisoli]MBB2200856.1 dihydrodipicolinate synthase family protein [Gluconacetobacter tumulisoli]